MKKLVLLLSCFVFQPVSAAKLIDNNTGNASILPSERPTYTEIILLDNNPLTGVGSLNIKIKQREKAVVKNDLNIQLRNHHFLIDSMYATPDVTSKGEVISMNLFNKGYLDATLEVKDKNGNLISVMAIPGNAPKTSVVEFTTDAVYRGFKALSSDYPFLDVRHPTGLLGNAKSEVKVFVPEGGSLLVSKNNLTALGLNFYKALMNHFPDFNDILKTKMKTISVRQKAHLLNELGRLSLDLYVDGKFQIPSDPVEFSSKVLSVIADALSDPSILDGRKKFEGAIKRWVKSNNGLLLFKEVSEKIAAILDTSGKVIELSEYENINDIKIIVDSCTTSPDSAYCPKNSNPFNQIVLLNTANKIQGNTSHFGSVDYYFNSFNRVYAYTNRQRETIQENPYLAAGSRIVEAPADIVLNWGVRPADLDSHLTGPVDASGRERFHTFYANRGSLDAAPNALLYRDDTSHGVGRENLPEQTRINVTQPGVYNFYVHDYSNMHQTGSMEMSNSGARVSLHSAGNRELPEGRNLGTKVAEYGIPTNREGTAWHVFELDTRRNVITPVNTLYNVSDPTKVPVK